MYVAFYAEKAKALGASFEIKGIIKAGSVNDTDLCVLQNTAEQWKSPTMKLPLRLYSFYR